MCVIGRSCVRPRLIGLAPLVLPLTSSQLIPTPPNQPPLGTLAGEGASAGVWGGGKGLGCDLPIGASPGSGSLFLLCSSLALPSW